MLFNSYAFIFGFLPVVFAGFLLLGRRSIRVAAAWLALASFFFYGWWSPAYIGLLFGSICVNYGFGRMLAAPAPPWGVPRRAVLVFAIVSNLALLGWYKYALFFATNINAVAGSAFDLGEIILPLGISFFTFTQIAFLVDTYRREAEEYSFVHYCLFVTYFPHLIAGPILHHKDMMPQFRMPATYRFDATNVAVGLTMFAFGLFKKVALADRISGYATPVFTAVAEGRSIGAAEAWGGALAYTLQLYFDFSGYSDMAIGLARMFNVRMPINFHSPYKAASIVEFWRRWHMSLSRFLRDYLYIALGGNRSGRVRRHINLLLTMLLGGLWHGAGWTFVVWGGLHGLYLMVNHAWRHARGALFGNVATGPVERFAGWAITFLAVIVGWVYFRAHDLASANAMLKAMAGLNGASVPVANIVPAVGWVQAGWTAALLAIALTMPNTQQILGRFEPGLHGLSEPADGKRALAWQPDARWAVAMSALTVVALLGMTKVSEFLYFQF